MGPKLKDTFTIVDQIASKGVIYFKYSNNIYGLELGEAVWKRLCNCLHKRFRFAWLIQYPSCYQCSNIWFGTSNLVKTDAQLQRMQTLNGYVLFLLNSFYIVMNRKLGTLRTFKMSGDSES